MKRFFTVLLSAFIFLTMGMLDAQVLTKRSCAKENSEIRKTLLEDPATVILPAVDTVSLITGDNPSETALPQFAVEIPVNLDMSNSGRWIKSENGTRMWTLNIVSREAYSLHLKFQQFYLAEGATLRISNFSGTMMQGPYTSRLNNPAQSLATDLLEGDGLRLVYTEPKGTKGSSVLKIGKVLHGYRDIFAENSPFSMYSYPVNKNQGTNQTISTADATALVIVDGTRLCAGFLVNTTEDDFKPYFLTSFHALDVAGFNLGSKDYHDGILQDYEIKNGENLQFRFKFMGQEQEEMGNDAWITYNRCKVKTAWKDTDLVLLELERRPSGASNILYLGWNPTEILQASSETRMVNGKSLAKRDKIVLPGSPCLDSRDRLLGHIKSGGFKGLDAAFISFSQSLTTQKQGSGLSKYLAPGKVTLNPPYITPSDTVVCSPQIFTLHDFCGGCYSIVWTTSSNLHIDLGQGTTSLQVSGSGAGWVKATIYDCYGNVLSSESQPEIVYFWMGTPDVAIGTPTLVTSFPLSRPTLRILPIPGLTRVSISAILEPGYTYDDIDYDWTITGGTIESGQGTDTIIVVLDPSQSYLNVGLTITNTCGSKSAPGRQFISATYLCPAPTAPVLANPDLKPGTDIYKYNIELFWTPSWTDFSPGNRYTVERATVASGPFYQRGTTFFPSFVDENVECNTRYYYRIKACNSCNNCILSNVKSVRTSDPY
ncbi:MAG: hypothetical protein GY757_16770 [bacterium]|nr:hypothetical protein [bacterium]